MKRQKLSKLLILLFGLFLLTGCWDQKEIDKIAYVIGIGLDKGDEEGRIKVSFLIANTEFDSSQGGGETNEPPSVLISFDTNDFISGQNTANTSITKEISFDILNGIFVSEEFAQDDDFIRWAYDAAKDVGIRRDTQLIVTKEQASKYLKNNKPLIETRPHRYYNLIIQRGVEDGLIPKNSKLHYYFRITEAHSDLFLATYTTTENTKEQFNKEDEHDFSAGEFHTEGQRNKTQFAGSAIFKKGKMIGKLTAEETRLATLLNNTLFAPDVLRTFSDPFNDEYRITTRVNSLSKNKVKMNLNTDTPTIHVTVPLVIDVLSNHSMTDYHKNKDNRKTLVKSVNKSLTEELNELIKKTQEEFKGEPFGWSLIARKQFLTIPEYKSFDWMKSYPDMKVNISVDIELGEFGRQNELPDLKELRD